MFVITARNVNDAYRKGLRLMSRESTPRPSRNGPVLRVDVPVSTVYAVPCERVLFDAQRNANPFFHLFEALWMLNGNNDTDTLDHILPSFKQFSDDGATFHGAYGYRWRRWPVYRSSGYIQSADQLEVIIRMLQRDPTSRRAVIGMWDPVRDLDATTKDVPCNDIVKCSIDDEHLDIQVFCRSNDIIYGCYGANAVHLSMLHEYLASMIGVKVGCYTQISCDYHAYLEQPYRWDTYWPLAECDPEDEHTEWTDDDISWSNPYDIDVMTHPLITNPMTFDRELRTVVEHVRARDFDELSLAQFQNEFFYHIAQPMYQALMLHKEKRTPRALTLLELRIAQADQHYDWLMAAHAWLMRKQFPQQTMDSSTRTKRAGDTPHSVEEPADVFHDAPEALRQTLEIRDPRPSTQPSRLRVDDD